MTPPSFHGPAVIIAGFPNGCTTYTHRSILEVSNVNVFNIKQNQRWEAVRPAHSKEQNMTGVLCDLVEQASGLLERFQKVKLPYLLLQYNNALMV